MSDEFVLRHGTATTEKALGAAARVEVIVGKVMNRAKRAMSELDLEDLALLVQHVRDVSAGPRLEHTWTVAELLARAEAAEQRAGAASAEAIPGGPPGGRYRVAPCPIHNTVQIDLVSGDQLCPHCVGDRSAWTVKARRPSYHAVHVHLKEGAEATARERFWAEADRGSHVELLHGDRVVRSVQVDAEGRTLHLPTDERARAQPGVRSQSLRRSLDGRSDDA